MIKRDGERPGNQALSDLCYTGQRMRLYYIGGSSRDVPASCRRSRSEQRFPARAAIKVAGQKGICWKWRRGGVESGCAFRDLKWIFFYLALIKLGVKS